MFVFAGFLRPFGVRRRGEEGCGGRQCRRVRGGVRVARPPIQPQHLQDVRGGEPRGRRGVRQGADGGAVTQVAYPLDQNAKYFRILVALCEPRLRDPSTSRIPTVPEIMERLPDLGLSRTAIGFHIGYLAEKKLHVKSPQSGEGKADWQRHALVSLPLRFDLVTSDHLALLPVPRR
ncbi:hypothetical protein [Nonomuraea fuscirosea]|uniref:hypothetical protein n=1 Tax=Nonomuraea fuscirosea TaxID=1291556 RepID=UPI0034278446